MKVYTSYYNKIAKDPRGLVPVRISTSAPDWFPYICEELTEVYPGWDLVGPVKKGLMDLDEYTVKYKEKLNKLGREYLLNRLNEISEENGGRDLVLVCWEAPDKFCHRYLIMEFLGLEPAEI